MIKAFFDGGIPPRNPGGIPLYGFLIYRDGELLKEGHGVAAEPFGEMATSNVAEYRALIVLLEYLLVFDLSKEKVVVRGDSQLVIKQVNRKFQCHDPKLKPFCWNAIELVSRFRNIELKWIPREQNRADALIAKAYREALKTIPGAREKVAELRMR